MSVKLISVALGTIARVMVLPARIEDRLDPLRSGLGTETCPGWIEVFDNLTDDILDLRLELLLNNNDFICQEMLEIGVRRGR
jgi:hypothetical protein